MNPFEKLPADPERERIEKQIREIKSFYVIGALCNEQVVPFSNALEAQGYEAFSDWKSPGPLADDFLRDYSKARGRNYKQILKSYAARLVYEFDRFHLDRTDAAVLLMKGGRSCHLELGYTIGRGKPGFIIFDEEPPRVDVMYGFATEVFFSWQEFFDYLKSYKTGETKDGRSKHSL
jgi:hypothetical protein